jgi:quinoprotein glucose dehydrogenase
MLVRRVAKCLFGAAVFFLSACQPEREARTDPFQFYYQDWVHYLGDPGRSHYTTLGQITKENVHELEIAWTYAAPDSGQMQMNPVVANGLLYGVTAGLRAFAVNAATGEEIWQFGDPEHTWHSTSRDGQTGILHERRFLICPERPGRHTYSHLW